MDAIAPVVPPAFDRYVPTVGPGDKVKALRLALKARDKKAWTQKAMALRAGFPEPEYVTRVEIGVNKLTSKSMNEGMAKAFMLTVPAFDAYLADRLTAEQVVAHLVDGAPLRLPGAAPAASIAFIEAGKTIDDAQPELRKLIVTDAIPEEHRRAIPALMRLEYATWRHFDTADGWLREAKLLAEEGDVHDHDDDKIPEKTGERLVPGARARKASR